MAWEQLSINKPHLVYIILGGFTSIFMLCSSVIKERLYIGEATVATLVGIIFGPHAANLINPGTWGNTDQITLEFSRIVLVVQCFAVGVELPKYYMEKHWKSVVFLLVPVMTFGWLITSLFIWAMFFGHLNWLDSLVCAACVTATDPVLASSVVGKGKFARRVPKHLRDLLSAESGCNDGMAFPFIYLGIYLIRYRPDANEVAFHWFCNTILYECIWGATYGVIIGYIARRAIRYAHEHELIDRESFLVFYFVLALFCAGSGSILGMDDLLIGFACGVGFSNDGWFLEKTEEAHVSNVIDLLINLAFFVYFGTIIPWETYNSAIIGTTPWKLVVIAILVVFFRRIPIMLALKPLIPDIKTWREALFAGHFGPIGVGALFVAILARAELETETTTPLAMLPAPDFPHDNIIELIWPITTFLVITSIIVHGSSIAVFTLGKHINTLTISLSYTQGNDQGNWMDRLPRIQSRSKSQMSRDSGFSSDLEEKLPDYPTGVLPKNFLRRQKEEDNPSRPNSRAGSLKPRRRRKWDSGLGPGGPVDPSAIAPRSRQELWPSNSPEKVDSSATTEVPSPENEYAESKQGESKYSSREGLEAYEEGHDTVIEDDQGNVLDVVRSNEGTTEEEKRNEIGQEVKKIMSDESTKEMAEERQEEILPTDKAEAEPRDLSPRSRTDGEDAEERPKLKKRWWSRLAVGGGEGAQASRQPEEHLRARGPARAFKFGNTIIVEDEDGEVIKKYDIPSAEDRKASYVDPERTRQRLQKVGKWMGMSQQETESATADQQGSRQQNADEEDDEKIRFTLEGNTRRMSKADFIKQLQDLDPKRRVSVVEENDMPSPIKEEIKSSAMEESLRKTQVTRVEQNTDKTDFAGNGAMLRRENSKSDRPQGAEGTLKDEHDREIPVHSFSEDLRGQSKGQITAAERRRRAASKQASTAESDSEDDGTERKPPAPSSTQRGRSTASAPRAEQASGRRGRQGGGGGDEEETAAERRRREAALGMRKEEDSSDEDEGRPRMPPRGTTQEPREPTALSVQTPASANRGIRFVDTPTSASSPRSFGNVRWATDKGR